MDSKQQCMSKHNFWNFMLRNIHIHIYLGIRVKLGTTQKICYPASEDNVSLVHTWQIAFLLLVLECGALNYCFVSRKVLFSYTKW